MIEPLQAADWEVYRDLRLAMVRNAPFAFDLLLEELARRQAGEWQADQAQVAHNPVRQRFIAKVATQAVGIVGLYPEENAMFIGGLFVLPEYRQQGIGSLLIDASLDFAHTTNSAEAALWVSSENTVAREWYERIGFAATQPPTTQAWEHDATIYDELLIKTV